MISDAIKEQKDVEVDRRRIDVRQAIKVVGEHAVEVSIYRDIKAEVKLLVTDEQGVVFGAEAPAEPEAVEEAAEEAVEEAAEEAVEEAAEAAEPEAAEE